MNEVVRLAIERAECTILVIIKLDPMATVLDNARARPIYLSSNIIGMMRERKGCVRIVPDVSTMVDYSSLSVNGKVRINSIIYVCTCSKITTITLGPFLVVRSSNLIFVSMLK
jgi:hypothetical protein